MPNILRILGLCAALLGLAAPAHGEERIISFDSVVEIGLDGGLTVTETITVRAEGDRIRRGIYRDIPTTYDLPGFAIHVVGFEMVGARRDGVPENWFTKPLSNGIRVYLGRENVNLETGTHTYRLTYRTDRQLGFFAGYDELYWNVTGNDWGFAIERARVTFLLPGGARMLQSAGYTGPQGAQGGDWLLTSDGRGNPVFETTRTLRPGEGLTAAVAWPKGFVTPPGDLVRARNLLLDNLIYFVAAGGLGLLLVFYIGAWFHVGRDPGKGTVVPRWNPPTGLSPAAARFVTHMAFDEKALGAAVVSLAVKGKLVIEEDGTKDYRLRRHDGGFGIKLPPGEKALLEKLFQYGDSVSVRAGNHEQLKPAVDGLKGALSGNYEGAHFARNLWVTIVGGILFVAVFMATMFIGISYQDFRLAYLAPAVMIIGAPLNRLFIWLMKAPTMKGRRLMDEIEGFKMYLATAEQERLDLMHPPERTPALFEKYLPYAMALGVETEWGEQFEDVLAAAAAGGKDGYSPGWYSGRHWHYQHPGRFAGSIGSSLGGAVASAATPPGSSSGSGGGGSSGGGGGGGGGGGW